MKSILCLTLLMGGVAGWGQTPLPKICGPNRDQQCVAAKQPPVKQEPPVVLPLSEYRRLALHQPDGPRCDKLNWPRTDIVCRALEAVVGHYILLQAKEEATPAPEKTK